MEGSLFESAQRFPDELLVRRGLRLYWNRSRGRYADSFVDYISRRIDVLAEERGRVRQPAVL